MPLSSVDLRVADADREAVAELLKRHYAAGRLTEVELSDRVGAAYRARVRSQLDVLVRDLPSLRVPAPRRRHTAGLLVIASLLVAIGLLLMALPDALAAVLVLVTVPVLIGLAVVAAPFAVAAFAVAWLVRALRPGP